MSTHHGFIKQFPFIRVDAFNGDPALLNPFTRKAPHFYLLTHAHTDHIAGLNSPHFHGLIYATPITKQLVLDTVEAADRVRYDELGHRVGRRLKFANLRKVKPTRASAVPGGAARSSRQGTGIDRIKEIPLNTRFEVEGPDGIIVTFTALDANHCPGSCMFLIEGTVAGVHRAVLITGDVRIEPWWLDVLRHNPLVEPYLPRPPHSRTAQAHGKDAAGGKYAEEHRGRTRALDCLYLDTSNVLLDEELVTKDQAVAAAVDLMAQYPPETRFFLNTWTWGYEELLKGVHRAFGDEIHLDWYKHRMYTSKPFRAADPLLAQLGTTASFPSSSSSSALDAQAAGNPSPSLHLRAVASLASTSTSTSAWPSAASSASASTSSAPAAAPAPAARASAPAAAPPAPRPLRFHACERRWRCDHVWHDGLGSYSFEAAHLPLLGGPKRLKRPGSGEVLPEDEGGGDARRRRVPQVVYVNPSEMPRWRWEAYRDEVQARIDEWKECQVSESASERARGAQGREDGSGKGKKRARGERRPEVELPGALIVPLARHSSLPELQSLVALFRPRTLYPLTCTDDDPVSPAHQYLSLPSLFGALLAPGGEAQLRDEAEQYRRHVLARQRTRGGRTSRVAEPSEETPPQDDAGDLIEPAWVTEMSRKGLNIEGGEDVLDEVVGWAQRLAKGERVPSASASPRGSKRARTSREEAKPSSVDVLELRDSSDDDDDNDMVAKVVARAPAGGRRLSYGSSSPLRRQRTDPVALDVGPSSSTAPYPPGDMPSPFLAAELTRRPCAPARDKTPDGALLPPRSASTALRLATTAVKAPPPRKSVTFSSPSRGGNGCASARPLTSAAPDGAAMLPPARRHALLPSFDLSSTASTLGAPHPRTSSSTSSSALPAPLAAAPAPPRPAARTPSSSKSASSASGARPPFATRAKRQAVVACLHRQLRGLIASQGGRVEPFQPGDPRLQGRRALRVRAGGAADQRSAQNDEDEAVKENVRGDELGEGEGKERSWDSPTSFRTVSVTASP